MGKVMNIFFGIGVAVIIYVVVLLGVQAFYPMQTPEDANYNCTYATYPTKLNTDLQGCSVEMTVGECLNYRSNLTVTYDRDQVKYDECYKRFNEDQKVYNRNLFLITNILGVLAIVIASFFVAMTNISAGVSFAGLALIIYGFARGWQSIGNGTKFAVAIIIAVLIIWLGVRFNKKKK